MRQSWTNKLGPGMIVAATLMSAMALPARAQDLVWVDRFGAAGSDQARKIVVAPSGDLVLVGSFRNAVDFDPGPGTTILGATGASDAYVTKLTDTGASVWVAQFRGVNNIHAISLDVDPAGNVYVGGLFQGTGDFDPGPGVLNLTANWINKFDCFMVKLDSSGNLVWALQFGNSDQTLLNRVALDTAGFGSPDFELAADVVVDAAQGVYVTGAFRSTADFDPGPGVTELTSLGIDDGFVLKLAQPAAVPAAGRGWLLGLGLAFAAALAWVLRRTAVA